ncbi:ELKS/Rab6-interacting/CAST family member 1a isoform X5 [Tachysurus ichikawai]
MYGSSRSVSKMEGNHSGSRNSQGNSGRSPRLPRSPRMGHRRTNSMGGSGGGPGGPGGKTLSMENIQSLNAAYATSGPMYMSDNEVALATSSDIPKSGMATGRFGGSIPYGVRGTVTGSTPDMAMVPTVSTDSMSFGGELHTASTVPHSLRQARDNTIMELQVQLKEVLRENELLRKEVEVKESKLSSSMSSIKTFWSPELKKERALRKDEASKIAVWKEQYRAIQDETQMDQVKQDLSRKDTQLLGLQTKLETLTNQFSDSKQHIEVLKESLTAKEQRAAILQTEVDALRLRLEEKETLLNKKSKQIQDMSEEKSTLNGEIHDLKDMLDVKERKINVLQKKIENLQEQLRDKEKQMSSLRERVKSLQTDTSNTDTVLSTLEDSLAEKERIIERLKEQRDREEREKVEELDSSKRELKELKEKVSLLQGDLSDRENSLLDLKEHASSLASSGLKKDSKLKTLEIALEQRREECSKLENQLKRAQNAAVEAQANSELSKRIASLEADVTRHREESGKAQAEVDRLLEILRQMENEKNDKDRKINELERQMKDQGKKPPGKHRESAGKGRSAVDGPQQESLRQKAERIEELEEALRESVQMTAEREMVLAQEEAARNHQEKQMEELLGAMEKVKQELESMKAKMSSTQQSLAEKEAHLTTLRAERRRHLEEVLEMKQEALLAAISEKDANIALLELSSSKKKKTHEEVAQLRREKDRLVQQLKQQTQNRMKLMADNYDDGHLKMPPDQTNHKAPKSPDQDDEEGIWA